MTDREAMQQALDVLEAYIAEPIRPDEHHHAREVRHAVYSHAKTMRAALAAQDRSPPVAPVRMLTDAEIYSCVGARSHDAQQLDDLLALFCKVNGLTLGAPPAGNTGEGEAT